MKNQIPYENLVLFIRMEADRVFYERNDTGHMIFSGWHSNVQDAYEKITQGKLANHWTLFDNQLNICRYVKATIGDKYGRPRSLAGPNLLEWEL